MSLQTSITLNSSQYINEMKKVGDASKEAMERVKKTSKEASAAMDKGSSMAQGLAQKINVAGVSLKDLTEAFSDSANSANALGALIATSFMAAINSAKELKNELDSIKASLTEIDKLQTGNRKLEMSITIDNTSTLASKMKELYQLREKETLTAEDSGREKVLLEDIKHLQTLLQEEGTLKEIIDAQTASQGKLRGAVADTLELAQEMKKTDITSSLKTDTEELEKLATELKELSETPDTLKNRIAAMWKDGNFNPLSPVMMGAGFAGMNLDKQKLDTVKRFEQLQSKILQERKELNRLNQTSDADAFIYAAKGKAEDTKAAREKKAAEDAEAYRKKEEEELKKAEAYQKEQDDIEVSNAKANRQLQNKAENLSITDKNTLSYKQAMDALTEEILDMKSAVDKNGNAVYDPHTVERYENLQKEKLAKDYEKSSIEDFLSQNRITDEVVKTNELTRRGGFQGGAVVIDNTQKQMLELQKGIRQVLEEVRKNTKGIEEKL